MKFSTVTLLVALAGVSHSAAFTPLPSSSNKSIINNNKSIRSFSQLAMSTADDEIARLRAAAAAAREEAAQLAKEMGKDVEGSASGNTATVVKKSSKSPEEVASAINAINFEGDATTQISILDELKEEGAISLYKSAIGSGDLRDYPVSMNMLESRTGLTADAMGFGEDPDVSLDDFKYATLYVVGGCTVTGIGALALLPENIGATVCYLVALIPVLWLGIGSSAPAFIAGLIASIKGTKEDEVNRANRICRHEAAHFLCGYLCGLPVASYATTDENIPRVEFHSTSTGPLIGSQELTTEQVNALAVVALSGSVAEAMKFGVARGAESDLLQLEQVFRKSKNFIGAQKQQDLTRWGALTAYRLLAQHKEKLEALVDAFEARKSVSECMTILEAK